MRRLEVLNANRAIPAGTSDDMRNAAIGKMRPPGPSNIVVACLVLLVLGACTPTACNDEERMVSREVELLIGESGPAVGEAKRRLLARGYSAIAILETGLYEADEIGRLRIVDILEQIAHEEVVPVLQHIARRDANEDVREHARIALKKLMKPTQ